MFSHNYSVFASSCVKTPLNPSSKLPNPSYLKPKCATMKETKTKKAGSKKCKKHFSSMLSLTAENNNFLSLKDFYDSIPDYNEMHHLSQYDFYKEIDTLKRKRNELRSSCFADDYFKNLWSKTENSNIKFESEEAGRESSSKHFNEFNNFKFDEYSPKIFKEIKTKPSRKGSAKSVRIETSDPVPYITPHDDNPTRIFKKSLRSKSASPVRGSTPNITITEPFNMTQREDDEKAFEDLISHTNNFLTPEKSPKYKSSPNKTKVKPVPITSKIPLFKQIMEDQEHRSLLAKLDSAMELNAQVKPFGFDNGPDKTNSRCLSRSLSSPQISTSSEPPKHFKANPVPKNLNSNYFQSKMNEEEYFRDMSKRVRAEELLKMASLPPSMKRREKSDKKKYQVHNCYDTASKRLKKKRKSKKSRISSASTSKTSIQSSSTKNEFITTCPHPFDLETEKRHKERPKKHTPSPMTTSSKSASASSLRTTITPSPMYPVNRPNLAATLRFEHSRNKLKELSERASSSLSCPVRPFRWGVKKTPGWQSLAYDPTHAEELQLRLATRQAEQKLRNEEFRMAKEMMIQRVKAAPLLLEGPTYWGPKVGQLSHHCGSENERVSSARHRSDSCSKRPNSSKLSNYSDSKGSVSTKIINLTGKRNVEFDDDYDTHSSEVENI